MWHDRLATYHLHRLLYFDRKHGLLSMVSDIDMVIIRLWSEGVYKTESSIEERREGIAGVVE